MSSYPPQDGEIRRESSAGASAGGVAATFASVSPAVIAAAGKSKKFFNTAGPVDLNDHYAVSPLRRIQLEEVLPLIDQKKYFVLHAPRQTGKTSCLLALRDYLNREGRYQCIYMNAEIAQGWREQIDPATRALIQ